MRRALTTCAVVLTMCAGGAAGNAAAATATGSTPSSRAVTASCVYAKIGGVRKCLRAGEYCARRYQRQYVRNGFTCDKLDYRGDWHLERL